MLRVGVINYINSLPIFHRMTEMSSDFSFILANPMEINYHLQNETLDIALVSSADFIENRFNYLLLPELGIASTTEFMSVALLFCNNPQDLDNREVFVPSHSATSTRLLQVLCRHFWKVAPKFITYNQHLFTKLNYDKPILLIGDRCLQAVEQQIPHIDLAQKWFEATGKSFVFALLATRNKAFKEQFQEIIHFQHIVEESYAWSQKNFPLIIKKAQEKTGLQEETITRYFQHIEYKLTPKHFQGLNFFSKIEPVSN